MPGYIFLNKGTCSLTNLNGFKSNSLRTIVLGEQRTPGSPIRHSFSPLQDFISEDSCGELRSIKMVHKKMLLLFILKVELQQPGHSTKPEKQEGGNKVR